MAANPAEDGAPALGRALAEQRAECQHAEHDQGRNPAATEATTTRATTRAVTAAGRRPHRGLRGPLRRGWCRTAPREQEPPGQRGQHGQRDGDGREVGGGSDVAPGERAADQASGEGSEAVAGVKRGHELAADRLLHLNRLGVHGDV